MNDSHCKKCGGNILAPDSVSVCPYCGADWRSGAPVESKPHSLPSVASRPQSTTKYRKIGRIAVLLSLAMAICWTIMFALLVIDSFQESGEGDARYFTIVIWMVGMWGLAIAALFVWAACHWMDKMLYTGLKQKGALQDNERSVDDETPAARE